MAVVLYQRSEPRQKDWLPLLSQQIRLRNITQILLLNIPEEERLGGQEGYFTLHINPMSAPYYTSPKVPFVVVNNGRSGGFATIWPEIQLSLCSTRLSASSTICRVWTGDGKNPILTWGVHFRGLHYLGHRTDEWNNSGGEFQSKTLIFTTPFGSFTSLCSLLSPPVQPQRFLRIRTSLDLPTVRSSYTLQKLVSLHHYQRSVLEEHALGERLKMDLGRHGFGVGSRWGDNRQQPTLLSERLIQRAKLGRQRLRLKEEIEAVSIKVRCLQEEKGRSEGRIRRLIHDGANYEELSGELVKRMHNFTTEKTNLKETKAALISKGQNLGKFRASVFLRKKQLISELLHIYPLELIEGSKKYSINGVQLPNAEDYGSETGGQISVALGYTSHLTAMLAFFLDIPCRYPIRHFGSRSRIIDHITVQVPDREREFPLYFKGKRDVYCAYAIYLLNKNVAQLRWYCGLSTPDLRATLPNLVELLTSRLVIPGWPPNIGEALEIAQEITEDIDSQFLENELTLSLDKGMDKMLLAVKDIGGTGQDPYLPDSLSDGKAGFIGGNSTALGDIQHGRGQDRFLSGWKKKTYVETDDFDPKWLMDSMNLDFDSGRKLSISNSSPPPRPIFVVSDDSGFTGGGVGGGGPSRRRRMGQVDAPLLNNLQEGKVSPSSTPGTTTSLTRTHTPSREIVRLELDIKEFERRKSRGAATSLGVPSSSSENQYSNATVPNKIINNSLLLSPPDVTEPSSSSSSKAGWTTTVGLNKEHHHHPILLLSSNSNVDLEAAEDILTSTTIDHDEIHVQHSEACNPIYHIPPPVVELTVSNTDNAELKEATIDVSSTVNNLTNNSSEHDDTKEKVHDESKKGCDMNESLTDASADNNKKDIINKSPQVEVDSDNNQENTENSLLWMRTDLLGSQSFNLVRRRMSASFEPT